MHKFTQCEENKTIIAKQPSFWQRDPHVARRKQTNVYVAPRSWSVRYGRRDIGRTFSVSLFTFFLLSSLFLKEAASLLLSIIISPALSASWFFYGRHFDFFSPSSFSTFLRLWLVLPSQFQRGFSSDRFGGRPSRNTQFHSPAIRTRVKEREEKNTLIR